MLKEIICNKFTINKIEFKNGLNVVLGDNLATNSIGKTTALMIVDFVFGGNSYITVNSDTVANVGHHTFKFMFEFNKENFYFMRSTDNYLFISICDSNYEVKDEISLNEYKTFLTDKYDVEFLGNSFRTIVGNFSRIWGKNNHNVEKPLKQNDSKMHDSIINLIKLFNRYDSIESFEQQLQKISNKKAAISKAMSNDLIPSINKTQYNKNCVEIEQLEKKIEKFMNSMKDVTLDIEAITSEEVMDMRKQKNAMIIERNKLQNRLKRIKHNLDSDDLKIASKLSRITEFFPTIDKDKLNSINDFHKKMSKTLKSELKAEEEQLLALIELMNKDIEEISKEVEGKLNIKSKPEYNVERLAVFINQKRALEERNSIYDKKEIVNADLDRIKLDLSEVKQKLLSDIRNQINIKMYELFKKIYSDDRKSPTFDLSSDSYDLRRPNDTGTGSSYINLIAFDISIFDLTKLPFLIHDSILFKNIQVEAFDNLVDIYDTFERQSFISIDEISRFSSKTQKTLETKSVIKLNAKETLFTVNWKLNSK